MENLEKRIAEQLTFFEPKEVVRPDLNIAKWAGFLFSSPWAKDLYEEKKFIFSLGEKGNASISIIPAVNRKRPTTTTQKVLYALVQIWEESGKPVNGRFFFSARQLAYILGWKWSGSSTGKRIQEHLSILNSTTVDWERSFYSGDFLETQKEEMHLIDAKSYLSREKMINQEFFQAQHNVRLNQDLVDNMIQGKTKPFNYKVFISIKNDTAIKLYNFLDNFLSKKNKWERKSYGLITEDLELSGKRYNEKRIRLAKLKDLVKELNGKELSTGKLSLSIALTVDKTDYKLVARKTPRAEVKSFRKPSKSANSKEDISEIVLEIIEGLSRVGTIDPQKHTDILKVLGYWYSRDMLLRALATVMVDFKGNIKTSPIRAYLYLVHKIAHENGLEWIKDCGKSCKCRPENQKNYSSSQLESYQDKAENEPAKNLESQQKKQKEKTKKDIQKELDDKRRELEKAFRIQAVKSFVESLSDERKEEIFSTLKEENFQVLRKAESIEDFKIRGFLVPFIPNFKKDQEAYVQENMG